MAHRSFGSRVVSDEAPRDPVTFDIGDETGIACRDNINGKLLLELVGKADSPNASVQVEGVLAIFDIAIRTDDGESPDLYTGKRYDRLQPLKHHTQAELDTIDDENDEIEERNAELRERNDAKREAAVRGLPPDGESADVSDDDLDLEEEEAFRQPGIDPTSSWGRLMNVLDDPNTRIDIEELSEISGWIVENVVGRPTRSAAGSRRGGLTGNRSSRRAQRSRG